MLKRNDTKITFVLPLDTGPVSVVGDFNGWDPSVHPLKKRSNGTRSVTVDVGPGHHSFRYLGEGGAFFDDADADGLEANGYGGSHSLLVIAAGTQIETDLAEPVDAVTPKRSRKLGRKNAATA